MARIILCWCSQCTESWAAFADNGVFEVVANSPCCGVPLTTKRPIPRAVDPPLADGTRTDSKNMFVTPESRTDGSAGN